MFVTKASTLILPYLLIASTLDMRKFILDTTPPASSSTANFLRLYQQREYLLILHVTNLTKYLANDFLAVFPTMNVIFNHDTIYGDQLKRPYGLHLLNLVIFPNPLLFSEYIKQSSNIRGDDVIVFLMRPAAFKLLEKQHAAMLPNLQMSGRVIVVVAGEIITNMYIMCFFCGRTSGTFVAFQTLKTGAFATNSSLLFASDYQNFHGHVLNVGYIDYFPYVYCEKKVTKNGQNICEDAVGLELDILITLSKSLNFKFQLTESVNQSYKNLISGLVDDKFDFAIGGLSMTVERRQFLQFTDVFKFEDVGLIFFYKEPFLSSVKKIFHVTFVERQSFFVISITISGLIYFINRYLAKTHISIMRIVEIIFQIGNDRPTNLNLILPKTFKSSIAIFLSIWFIYAMLSNIFYKSKLLSILVAHPVLEIQITDLVNENYVFVTDSLAAKAYSSMLQPELPLNKFLVKNYDLCKAFDELSNRRIIILGEVSRHVWHFLVDCQNYFSGKFPNGLIVQSYGVTPFAWPFRKGSPFVKSFNHYNKLMSQSGLREVWWRKVLLRRGLYKHFISLLQTSERVVRLNGFVVQLIMYCFLISCTVFVLVIEIVIFRLKQYNKQLK